MDIVRKIAQELDIREKQAEAAIRLIDEGNTVPFIARYRKEATGSLNDEILRRLEGRIKYLRNLEDKKAQISAAIEEQGKLTPELRDAINSADQLITLEDIYRPFRPKRRTRAMIAEEKGLKGLADAIMLQQITGRLADLAQKYVDADAETSAHSTDEAVQGACDILAERIADNAEYRKAIRKLCLEKGILTAALKNASAKENDKSGTFEAYYDYSENVKTMPGHRILAVNRGEALEILKVKIEMPDEQITSALKRAVIHKNDRETSLVLEEAVNDGFRRLIAPSIEREIRSELTERAEDSAMSMFDKNLAQLLMQPPIAGKTVLGWDPAFRTGCKLAVVDPTGRVLDTAVIYPTAPHNKVTEAKQKLSELTNKYNVDVISLGNGTASRESEQIICEFIKETDRSLKYVIVNEAGASVYSASETGAKEFPSFDVGQRSAVSMARRLQDPLAELVKMDPKAIGVGQYQHDMDQKKLAESLEAVIEDCVNRVGVDLNTASASLLGYVAGISKTVAENIVTYREAAGRFENRRELLKVAKLGPKAYEQCAGFLRIRGGSEVLDMTAVHPESYAVAYKLLDRLGINKTDISSGGIKSLNKLIGSMESLADELDVGVPTLKDIIAELEKPGRDPRSEMPQPILKSDVMEMSDLKEGMILQGTVRNIVDFGAFVDIGVHQDGLVHISELSDRYIKNPMDVVAIGDIVRVKVLGVDQRKGRISLSMKGI